MYGLNDPRGFIPKYFNNGSQSNAGMTTTNGPNAFIQSGYGQNIGIGDPVVVYPVGGTKGEPSSGYIASAASVGTTAGNLITVTDYPILGIFQGCYYDNDTNATMYPNQPMLQAWNAGTVTANGKPAGAYIIPTNYQCIYSVQTSDEGAEIGALYNCVSIVFTIDTGTGLVVLNNDQSTVYVGTNTGMGSPFNPAANYTRYSSVMAVGFDNQPSNTFSNSSQIGLPYGNILVQFTNIAIPQFSSPIVSD